MGKNGVFSDKKNENSHNSLIKVTFSKKIEMCVCKTLFKNTFLQKNLFSSLRILKSLEEEKNPFPFPFVF
jgi:hypothetical protein